MGLEFIIGIAVAAIAAIAAAFGLGKYKGRVTEAADRTAATAKADAKRTVESANEAVQAQLKANQNANEVRDEVARAPDGNAIDELRRDYTRD